MATSFATAIFLGLGLFLGCANAYFLDTTRIVGGLPAILGQVPYILSLQIDGHHSCGASIIEVQGLMLAISAAHCTSGMEDAARFNMTVVAGELKLSDASGDEQIRRVTRVINHDFDWMTKRNDISLLFLEKPFELNNNIKTIELQPNGESVTSGNIRVSGWGLLSEQGLPSDDLMTAEIPVVSDETCRSAYAKAGVEIFDDFLCAGVLGIGGIDSCQMDSGGPAVKDGKLVGIVSFGIGCARPDYLGVYTETSFFNQWVENQVALYKRSLLYS